MISENKQKKLLDSIASKSEDKNFIKFIYDLYQGVLYEDLVTINPHLLYTSAKSTFNLFQAKRKEEIKIEVEQVSYDKNSYVLIEIICTDIPFLLESIRNEIKLQKLEVQLIVNPLFQTKRDNQGKILSFNQESNKKEKEAVLQFYITSDIPTDNIQKLTNKLREIIECTIYAVNDWRAMKSLMSKDMNFLSKEKSLPNNGISENIKFLNWLIKENFIFLGSVECKYKNKKAYALPNTSLGIMRHTYYKDKCKILIDYAPEDEQVFVKKSELRSIVHRKSHMLAIFVKNSDASDKYGQRRVYLGFLSSKVYYQSVLNIPLINQKANEVIKRYGYQKGHYHYKKLVKAIEEFPRSELLQMNENDLFDTVNGIVSLTLNPKLKLFIRKDSSANYLNCLIFIPKSKYTPNVQEVVERILCQQFNGKIIRHYVSIGHAYLVRLHFIIGNFIKKKVPNYDSDKIEKLIIGAISVWQEDFQKAILNKHNRKEAIAFYTKYKDVFDLKYTSHFAAQQAVHDMRMIEKVLETKMVGFDIYVSAKSGKGLVQLKTYALDNEIHLSSILPIIENLGFFAIDVDTFKIQILEDGYPRKIYIHHFRLTEKNSQIKFVFDDVKHKIEDALDKILQQKVEDDGFNSLILYAGISWRDALILRAYSKYLKQIKFEISTEFILETLVKYNEITSKLIEFFYMRFLPSNNGDIISENALIQDIRNKLNKIQIYAEDKVLNSYLHLILATKRTNFFQKDTNGNFKDYISFKIHSKDVLDMPLPKPYIETFVYSVDFEGIHLRGGKVARGGIRWSDRKEDYRTEVLGLMKAQMTKNSVIIPVGSKGGFLVKKQCEKNEFYDVGVTCYKRFLSGILDITDNIENDIITHPKDVVRHDNDDTYLVVAADKGTATFSDFANNISQKYNFWLGDAFASGSSSGYDHKKIGITAKGAWISVKEHFLNLGININQQAFTVVGIGDMSGDVFGNGMLLSKNIKLIAAFNHQHIFLDPDPDLEISYKERTRLFNKPGSKWSDYNSNLISNGGGVFERSSKKIHISPQVKGILLINQDILTPDQLISSILKAPVDLLWNGGIGTYVKASQEGNDLIGDKSNIKVRVNGNQLKCRVVAEGGNLGLTQLGRIEYAKKGGKINTDFIDNSAGVDCSDHEVNIKIGLNNAINNHSISIKSRNELLASLTNEVADLVLKDNTHQAQLITIEELGGCKKLDEHIWLIKTLESQDELDRELEKLPSDDDLTRMKSENRSLTRPEISVLIAYAKNSAAKILSNSSISDENYFSSILLNYFPKILQKKIKQDIASHRLKNEIIKTTLVNEFINTMGCCFFHKTLEDSGYDPLSIIKAFFISFDSANIALEWQEIQNLSGLIPVSVQSELFYIVQEILSKNISWILRTYTEIKDVNKLITFYKKNIADLRNACKKDNYIVSIADSEFSKLKKQFNNINISERLLQNISLLKLLIPAFDIVRIVEDLNCNMVKAAKTYFKLRDRLHISWMLNIITKTEVMSYLDKLAFDSIESYIQDLNMRFTIAQINTGKDILCEENNSFIPNFITNKYKFQKYDNFIKGLKDVQQSEIISAINVALKYLRECSNI